MYHYLFLHMKTEGNLLNSVNCFFIVWGGEKKWKCIYFYEYIHQRAEMFGALFLVELFPCCWRCFWKCHRWAVDIVTTCGCWAACHCEPRASSFWGEKATTGTGGPGLDFVIVFHCFCCCHWKLPTWVPEPCGGLVVWDHLLWDWQAGTVQSIALTSKGSCAWTGVSLGWIQAVEVRFLAWWYTALFRQVMPWCGCSHPALQQAPGLVGCCWRF